jgi:hypothetical protein
MARHGPLHTDPAPIHPNPASADPRFPTYRAIDEPKDGL